MSNRSVPAHGCLHIVVIGALLVGEAWTPDTADGEGRMLSDREQRILERTARELARAEPRLDEQLRRHRFRPAVAAPAVVIGLVVACTVALLALGLVGEALVFVGAGALLVVALRPTWSRPWRALRRSRAGRPDGS